MIDTFNKFEHKFIKPSFWNEYNLQPNNYLLVTIHRPANADNKKKLQCFLNEIISNSNGIPIVFLVHPRTKKTLSELNISANNLFYATPMTYLEFNYLAKNAKTVITDSFGITKETTVMGVPCITLRDNTERPETMEIGTNELIGTNPNAIKPALEKLYSGNWKKAKIKKLWDVNTAKLIINTTLKLNLKSN